MTRDRILEAAAHEIERNGLTQFRVKRVALEANISIALLYSYFEDREDLIAATVVYRFRQVLVGLAEIFTQGHDLGRAVAVSHRGASPAYREHVVRRPQRDRVAGHR